MPTRREALAGGVGALALVITGCSSILLRSEDSDESDGRSDQNTEVPSDDGETDGSSVDRKSSSAATIDHDIEIDRGNRPRIGDPIDIEFTVSNDGKRSGAYDYRLRLEHEDGLLGGDERISGKLSGGNREGFDLEFAPPRAGTVAVLVDDEIVDEFTVRSRRGDGDDEADDDDEADGDGDNAGSVATGGEGTVVGKAASAS